MGCVQERGEGRNNFSFLIVSCNVVKKQLMFKAGRGHQALRKTAHSLRKDVGQNIKDEKRDKKLGTETHPGRES